MIRRKTAKRTSGRATKASVRFDKGLKTRREVLGSEYVDQGLAKASDFSWPMQQLTTEYCWNEIWNRPGLDRRSRSILNLGMLAAMNRSQEFKLHVRGALNNGLSVRELREIMLQIAVYCGVPAGMEAFRLAESVLIESGQGARARRLREQKGSR